MLGRTKMGAWQDRNGILAGQKWELGRSEMGSLQEDISNTPHFKSFSANLFSSLSISRTVWQDSFAENNF